MLINPKEQPQQKCHDNEQAEYTQIHTDAHIAAADSEHHIQQILGLVKNPT